MYQRTSPESVQPGTPGYVPLSQPQSQLPGPEPPLAHQRPVQRRATQACLQCRVRKVRCDLQFQTGSCTNCQLDQIECRVASSKRRQKTAEKEVPGSHDNQHHAVNLPSIGHSDILQRARALPSLVNTPRSEEEDYSRKRQGPFISDRGKAKVKVEGDRSADYFPRFGNQHQEQDIFLPEFIQPFQVQKMEDMEVLRERSVFVLLPAQMQMVILDHFEQFIYPNLPILDISDLRSAISGGDPNKKIPLVLYHALMFVGLSVIPSDIVLQLFHASKLAARDACYERAKTLLQFGVERDRIVLCQASLMLYGRIVQNDPVDVVHWVGNAISEAHSLQLYKTEPSPLQTRKRNLRRLIWWSVLVVECEICTNLGLPPRVWPFGTPMIAMSDFGLEEADISTPSPEDSKIPAAKAAMIFILKAKLCNQIYHVMRHIHEDILPWTARPTGRPHPGLRQYLAQQLRSWYSEVPSEFLCRNIVQVGASPSQPGLASSMAVVEMMFWTAHLLIFRDDMTLHLLHLSSPESMASHSIRTDYSRHLLRNAASEVVGILERFLGCNMGHLLLPTTLPQMFLSAGILFQDANDTDRETCEDNLRKIDVCLEASQSLLEIYPALDHLATKIQQVAQDLRGRVSGEQRDMASSDGVPFVSTLETTNLNSHVNSIDHESNSQSSNHPSNTHRNGDDVYSGYLNDLLFEGLNIDIP
ncbi:hypothetical protein BJX99DRAFT_258549 [Aspergillus californicus]